MTPKVITLFMWGYQMHFRSGVRFMTDRVLEEIGAAEEARVILVGVRIPGGQGSHPVCVEPETDTRAVALFSGLDQEVETEYPKHPNHTMFYGDSRAMDEKPENVRRAVVRELVAKRLEPLDAVEQTFSYVSAATPIAGYHVVIVLQIPRATLDAHPEVEGVNWEGEPATFSFLRACLSHVAHEATVELNQPEPGRHLSMGGRDASEIVRRAGASFVRDMAVQISPRAVGSELWPVFNDLAALRYEGGEGFGRIVFAARDTPGVKWTLRFTALPKLRDIRWVRKLLEMSSSEAPLISTTGHIQGVGRPDPALAPHISVDFHGHHQWELRLGEALLLRVEAGAPRLPLAAVPPDRFRDTIERRFAGVPELDVDLLLRVLAHQSNRRSGSLVVIGEDASAEGARLAVQSTAIYPTLANDEVLERASRIDGAILLDPTGVCHAVGVILDGPAHDSSSPARGARYNTALRYVQSAAVRRLAIVVSDDGMVDVLPLLRPRLSADEIEAAIRGLEASTHDNYHPHRLFLEEHRFYVDADQCCRINAALDRIDAEPSVDTQIRLMTTRFAPHPDFDASYLK